MLGLCGVDFCFVGDEGWGFVNAVQVLGMSPHEGEKAGGGVGVFKYRDAVEAEDFTTFHDAVAAHPACEEGLAGLYGTVGDGAGGGCWLGADLGGKHQQDAVDVFILSHIGYGFCIDVWGGVSGKIDGVGGFFVTLGLCELTAGCYEGVD